MYIICNDDDIERVIQKYICIKYVYNIYIDDEMRRIIYEHVFMYIICILQLLMQKLMYIMSILVLILDE